MKRNISIIIILLGFSLIISYYIYDHNTKQINEVKAYEYLGKPVVLDNNNDDIIGVLSIPKINFKMGFYNYNSKNNNVDKNIALITNVLPDEENKTMIIAAHSGNSYLGFFKDLDKLYYNDIVEIDYNNKKYFYIVDNIYNEEKGKITYNKNIKEQALILTTCSKQSNKQLVIITKLFKIN